MNVCNYENVANARNEYTRIRPMLKYLPIDTDDDYFMCVNDLLKSKHLCKSKNFIQHGRTSCYQHQLSVSYYTYKLCKFFKLNADEAARGALLHDLFLYDWHNLKGKNRFKHSINHPKVALENARKYFELTDLEEEVILKHMWPLSPFPKHLETYIVTFMDKMCCVMETLSDIFVKEEN